MRFLANEDFPYDAVVAMRESGEDVAGIRTDMPGITDEAALCVQTLTDSKYARQILRPL